MYSQGFNGEVQRTFIPPQQPTAGNGATAWFVGDFNGDGISDIASFYASTGIWKVATGLPNGQGFNNEVQWSSGQGIGSLCLLVGDFNGDGLADIANYQGSGRWWIATSNGSGFNGEVQWTFAPPSIPTAGNGATSWFVGDFNGDGISDIASFYASTGIWKVAIGLPNGQGFNNEVQWSSGQGIGSLCLLVGDFDGDGLADIANYQGSGRWWIATSNGSGFNGEVQRTFIPPQQPTAGNGATSWFAGDFDGDGYCDIASFYASTGIWKVATGLPHGQGFKNEIQWSSGQGIGSLCHLIGDFNGDGLADKANYQGSGRWWIATSINSFKKIVAVDYMLFYDNNDTSIDPWKTKDTAKTPVTGWGSDTVSGVYDERRNDVISRQIDAMQQAGINLIFLDRSNLYFTLNGDQHHMNEDTITQKFFQVMATRSPANQIQIAIQLGAEFWAELYWNAAKWNQGTVGMNWSSWDSQYSRQRNALNDIKSRYAQQFSGLYYPYKGRPLVPAFLNEEDYNYPPYNFAQPLWHYNDFTVKPVTGFHDTRNNNRLWWYGCYAPASQNLEAMTVMPGRHNWGDASQPTIDRQGGSYYINSWLEVIRDKPMFTFITDWNNFHEEFAIEGCGGTNGWKDYYGSLQPDWYLQITSAYSTIFKTEVIPSGTYVWEEKSSSVYLVNGHSLTYQGVLPHSKPVIRLPQGWLSNHRYSYQNLNKSALGAQNVPYQFTLLQNYPNPFNPTTTISYAIPLVAFVKLAVYDELGRQIQTLVAAEQQPGNYTIDFDASALSSGVYYCVIQAGSFRDTKKMILMR